MSQAGYDTEEELIKAKDKRNSINRELFLVTWREETLLTISETRCTSKILMYSCGIRLTTLEFTMQAAGLKMR